MHTYPCDCVSVGLSDLMYCQLVAISSGDAVYLHVAGRLKHEPKVCSIESSDPADRITQVYRHTHTHTHKYASI